MPRRRAREAQQDLEKQMATQSETWPTVSTTISSGQDQAWTEVAAEEVAVTPQQPHLPTMTPTLVDKLDAAIRHREHAIGATQEKQRKANAKADAEVAYLRRDSETLRLAREQLLEETERWPVNAKDGDVRIVMEGNLQRVWTTYYVKSGWRTDGSTATPGAAEPAAGV